ncbi:ABC transporter substrate-binding protein [Rhizobium sp. AN95]|uniref:ABC transporter substrate-binding protein n=1 Tax=Rhizobium sp. AN95 TaxID=3035216 RepID=UPI002B25E123|nr:ABC transporter substrate-binding protein [Rhizobium sp. AN95]
MDSIKIGSMLPFGSASRVDAQEFRNGARLAIDEINTLGGINGRKLKLVCVDSGDQSAGAVVAAARRLINEHGVHAIINGYNMGSHNAEYDVIADAGIIYIHSNTTIQHHDTIASDPHRYFGCLMGNPADYWYGQGFIKFISWLRDTGQWRPDSNRLAIISGSRPYSIVIANAMKSAAKEFGWVTAFGPEIVDTPTKEWRNVLDRARAVEPSILVNTHFYAHDLAHFQNQFLQDPFRCLVYLQYGGMHKSFGDIVGKRAEGVLIGTVVGLLQDESGKAFAHKYMKCFGELSTPEVGCLTYSSVRHYGAAAAIAGGTGAPFDPTEQNRKVAEVLVTMPFRSVVGTINYHPTGVPPSPIRTIRLIPRSVCRTCFTNCSIKAKNAPSSRRSLIVHLGFDCRAGFERANV